MEEVKWFPSSEGNVWKAVFTKPDAVYESVLYRYDSFEERTVICCSVQSGCPVGCVFCGTGRHFVRNLTVAEIIVQVQTALTEHHIHPNKCKRFQVMFMSMGEPMLNWDTVRQVIYLLHGVFPSAELLVSTIGVNNDNVFQSIIDTSVDIDKVGLQFSVHSPNDLQRDVVIPFKNKMDLRKLRDAGTVWWKATGRKVYLNYCCDPTNSRTCDYQALTALFSPLIFNFTFSVICESDENNKHRKDDNMTLLRWFSGKFSEAGYNTRVFNPAGQDDIGGGCGQLWYVQQWLKNHKQKEKS